MSTERLIWEMEFLNFNQVFKVKNQIFSRSFFLLAEIFLISNILSIILCIASVKNALEGSCIIKSNTISFSTNLFVK